MILPVTYWKLSEREIFKHFLSIGDAIGIPIMAYNNPATSGLDMSPELWVQMFDTIDNVTMAKESTGDLSRMKRINALSDGRLPFCNGSNPWSWTRCRRAPRDGAQPRRACYRGPASTCMTPYALANCQQHKLFTLNSSRCWVHRGGRPGRHGEGRPGALGVGVGAARRPLLPLDDEVRAALQKLLTDA